MARSKSSRRWLDEHVNDPYVKQAQKDGYRSRASYKLLELNAKDRLIRPGMLVLDLGAAPGGWSQVAAQRVGAGGRVIAFDLLDMPPLPGVEFHRGDINDDQAIDMLLKSLPDGGVDLVISDMAPNISGVDAIDQPRSIQVAEMALDVARKVLHPGGDMLIKLFQGGGLDAYIKELRRSFRKVVHRKPQASRARSREVYVLGREFHRE